MNWNKIISVMPKSTLTSFVFGDTSAKDLYSMAIAQGIGPEVRPMIRSGAARARKITREALRRRGLLS